MEIKEKIKLAPYTTFKIGGEAKYFGVVKDIEDLKEGVNFAKQNSLPVFILGGGSNLLISDNGFDGLVLKIENKDLVVGVLSDDLVEVVVGAGMLLDDLAYKMAKKNLWGLESLSWIPGTVGAGVVQNCGAFGVEMKDVVDWVEVFDMENGEMKRLLNKECEFGYRNSVFKKEPNWVVVRVALRLRILDDETLDRFACAREDEKQSFSPTDFSKKNPSQFIGRLSSEDERGEASSVTIAPQSSLRGVERSGTTKQSRKANLGYKGLEDLKNKKDLKVKDVRKKIIEIRGKNYPLSEGLGSAGCFFKNPIISKNEFEKLKEKFPETPFFEDGENIKIPIAWFIDQFEWKGFFEGEVGVYNKHALMLVNKGEGTCEEVKKLAQKIEKDVFEKTGLRLEREVVFV
ncbi:FAD-binding protein [Patescibacteria group bacterium]|nr:FAD-binding protein [Patescibacteria group bacterium]